MSSLPRVQHSGLRVVIMGYRRHARALTALLNTHADGVRAAFYGATHIDLARAAAGMLRSDAAIFVGGPRTNELIEKSCSLMNRPAILLWVGSDVLELRDHSADVERLRLSNVMHWTCSAHLVPELSCLGIEARFVNIVAARVPAALRPMPARFTVLAYLPQPRRNFYGQQTVWEAARALRDARFIVVGAGKNEPDAPPNVEYVGEVPNIDDYIDASSVILRMTAHDGFPKMIVEAVARGRHAIWTHELPGVMCAASAERALETLANLQSAHLGGTLRLNEAGAEYAAASHRPEMVATEVASALTGAVAEQCRRFEQRPKSTHRVAISGHAVLATRVAMNCSQYFPALSTSVLSTRSHTDIALSALDILTSNYWYTIGEPVQPRIFELAAAVSGKLRVVHWLARDVALVQGSRRLLSVLKRRRYCHVAQDETVAHELQRLGIQAQVFPIAAVRRPPEVAPLPSQFTIMLYLPREEPQFYGRYQYEQLMNTLKNDNVRYILVGGGHIEAPGGVCVEYVPWQADLSSVYDRSTVLLRLTPTDSISVMILEALLHGRYVVSSSAFPHVVRINGSHDLEIAVRSLLSRHVAGTLKPCDEVVSALEALYAPERCLGLLVQTLGAA